jgi:hypothetical protein
MKKQLLFIAIAGLFTSMASAADLYVRDLGAGGAYPTIGAAITAAVDGDRIIIRPKAAGLPYIENLTIDKSLSFVSETNFSKYLVQGTVSVSPAVGRVVTVNNMSVTSSFSVSGSTTGGRTTVNVYNSTLGSFIDATRNNTSLNMSGCVVTNYITCTHGRITGNRAEYISISTTATDLSPSTDDIEIIANVFTTNGNGAIYIDEKNYAVRVLNNYLGTSNAVFSTVKNNSNNEIRNNVFNNTTYTALVISIPTTITSTFSVLNNVLTTSQGSPYGEITNDNTATTTVYAINNISTSTFSTIGVAVATGNIGNATLSFNNSTYICTGTALVNAGAADDDYADIDLTRNDIGPYGGSDSWTNYWPTAVGNKPQVNYLNTPRRIYSSTTEMNATGSGYSK